MIGEVIGKHRVTASIAEGDTGTVYRAEHTVIGRPVAIKFLRPEFSQDRQLMSRFFDELRTVTTIHHPSIVELFDFGYHDGTPYVIMEYLEYETLAARIRREAPMRVSQVLDIIRQVAGALDAAHQAGVTHRELEPGNIVLVPDSAVPGGERVKLFDVGMAVLTDPATGTRARRGRSELPTYMAPEQLDSAAAGERGADVDHRADLYALGCIMFEMLSGRPPFTAASAGELAALHGSQPPPSIRRFAPDVSLELESIVRTLLAKKPGLRHASAGDFLDALDVLDDSAASAAHSAVFPDEPVSISFIQSHPVAPAPPATDQPAPPAGNRGVLTYVAIAAVVLIVAAVLLVLAL